MASLSLIQSDPKLGDTVTFAYETDKHEAQLRIQLVAYGEDLDGNGYADLIYGADQEADSGFKLGSEGSLWIDRGGPATCRAVLYHNLGHYEAFATLEFAAGG